MKAIYEASTHDKPVMGNMSSYHQDGLIHWHENIELLYFYDGECSVLNDDSEIAVKAGDLVVVNSEAIHMVKFPKGETRYIYYIISNSFCEEMGFSAESNFIVKRIRDERIQEYFKIIEKEVAEQGDYYYESIKINLLNVLLILFREYTETPKLMQKKSVKIDLAKKIVQYLQKNIKNDIDLEDIEKHCGYSKFYISKVFKEVTGKKLINYFNEIRMEKAKKMLLSGVESINEIALKCGFESQSYFGKVFKKYTGFSPLEFKKNI